MRHLHIVILILIAVFPLGCNEDENETLRDALNEAAEPTLTVSLGEQTSDNLELVVAPDKPGRVQLTIEAEGIEYDDATRAAVEVLSATALTELPEGPLMVTLVKKDGSHSGILDLAYAQPGAISLRTSVFDKTKLTTIILTPTPDPATISLSWPDPIEWATTYKADAEVEQLIYPTVCVTANSDATIPETATWTASGPSVLESSVTPIDTDAGDAVDTPADSVSKCSTATLYVPGNLPEDARVPITLTATVRDATLRRVISPCYGCSL